MRSFSWRTEAERDACLRIGAGLVCAAIMLSCADEDLARRQAALQRPSQRVASVATETELWVIELAPLLRHEITSGGTGATPRGARDESWSPRGDAVLILADDGRPAVWWLEPRRDVAIPAGQWPASFDLSGRFVVWVESSEGVGERTNLDASTTVVADSATGAILVRWPGIEAGRLVGRSGISAYEGEPVGLIESSHGTTVHHPRLATPRLLPEARGATWSADTLQVAYARAPAQLVEQSPGVFAAPPPRERPWTIEVLDVVSGHPREVLRLEPSVAPPVIEWNADGSALLVRRRVQ